MLLLISGPPGGATAEHAAQLARDPVWIVSDTPAPLDATVIERPPWDALMALSERIAHPEASELHLSTLDGFGTPPTRRVSVGDHSPETARLSKEVFLRRDGHGTLVLASLSGFFEQAIAKMAQSTQGSDAQIAAARQIAASAVTHLVWNLSRGRAPVIAICWEGERTLKGKVVGEAIHAPKGVIALADGVIRFDGSDYVLESARAGFSLDTLWPAIRLAS